MVQPSGVPKFIADGQRKTAARLDRFRGRCSRFI